jgi:hypothetical protein
MAVGLVLNFIVLIKMPAAPVSPESAWGRRVADG